jgi:hypothetical protein
MGEHQLRLWRHMFEATEEFLAGLKTLAELTNLLEASLDAAEIKDKGLVNEFYQYWDSLECVNAPSLDPGRVPEEKLGRKAAEQMRAFLLRAQPRFRDYDASRY